MEIILRGGGQGERSERKEKKGRKEGRKGREKWEREKGLDIREKRESKDSSLELLHRLTPRSNHSHKMERNCHDKGVSGGYSNMCNTYML